MGLLHASRIDPVNEEIKERLPWVFANEGRAFMRRRAATRTPRGMMPLRSSAPSARPSGSSSAAPETSSGSPAAKHTLDKCLKPRSPGQASVVRYGRAYLCMAWMAGTTMSR